MSKKVETEKERELRWQTERDFEILMDFSYYCPFFTN